MQFGRSQNDLPCNSLVDLSVFHTTSASNLCFLPRISVKIEGAHQNVPHFRKKPCACPELLRLVFTLPIQKRCFLHRALSSGVPAIPNVILPMLGAHFRFAHGRVKPQGSPTWFAKHFISASCADVPLASATQHLSCQKATHAQVVHVFKLITNFPVKYSSARSKLDWNALSRSFLDISHTR